MATLDPALYYSLLNRTLPSSDYGIQQFMGNWLLVNKGVVSCSKCLHRIMRQMMIQMVSMPLGERQAAAIIL